MVTTISIVFQSKFPSLKIIAEAIKDGILSDDDDICVRLIEICADKGIIITVNTYMGDSILSGTCNEEEIWKADGYIFGMTTKDSSIPWSIKAIMDRSIDQWQFQTMRGKPSSLFYCSSGSYDLVSLACVTFFAHHGIIFVPLGYTQPGIVEVEKDPHGISPWACGTASNEQPSELEVKTAKFQGNLFARIVSKLK
ncbi:hypothetical protein GJ496_008859 [Pomphorhynchus laevis]|nr:hypothetical protein GJ496_008859 [Pomphorhynchus laevis]